MVLFIRIALALAGIAGITIGVASDWLGIGNPGFGETQILFTVVGCGLLLGALAGSRVAVVMGGLLAGLLIAEAGLLIVERVGNSRITDAYEGFLEPVPDVKLGLRLKPNAPGHDAKGFRNKSVPRQADIVAIGDSQTWGVNAEPRETWPARLGRLSGRDVYNMSLGYYGPVQYWVLTEEALALSPKVVIIGLYFGNDIWGAYQAVYRDSIQAEFRNKEIPGDLSRDTIGLRANELAEEETEFQTAFPQSASSDWRAWMRERSAVIRLLYRRGLWPGDIVDNKYEAAKAWAFAHPEHGSVYENGHIRTVFTTAYRLIALDLDEPRIAEGLRITKETLLRIQERTKRSDVKLLVLLIPTKEMVYAKEMRTQKGNLGKIYAKLIQMETRVRDTITSFCEKNGIEYIDALPVLMKAVDSNKQIYLTISDGHPNAYGYFLIASAVKETLNGLNW